PYLTSSSRSISDAEQGIHPVDHVTGWELFGRMGVRKGKWKATFIPKPFGPGKWQLFDLARDPGETEDLGVDRKDKLLELLRAYEECAKCVGVVESVAEYGVVEIA